MECPSAAWNSLGACQTLSLESVQRCSANHHIDKELIIIMCGSNFSYRLFLGMISLQYNVLVRGAQNCYWLSPSSKYDSVPSKLQSDTPLTLMDLMYDKLSNVDINLFAAFKMFRKSAPLISTWWIMLSSAFLFCFVFLRQVRILLSRPACCLKAK